MLVSMITGIVTLLLLAQALPYAGSSACKSCHPAIYARWSKTRMANVITDPKLHPEVIIPDLSKPNPLVKFTKADIAFVYGTKWKQRYFTRGFGFDRSGMITSGWSFGSVITFAMRVL